MRAALWFRPLVPFRRSPGGGRWLRLLRVGLREGLLPFKRSPGGGRSASRRCRASGRRRRAPRSGLSRSPEGSAAPVGAGACRGQAHSPRCHQICKVSERSVGNLPLPRASSESTPRYPTRLHAFGFTSGWTPVCLRTQRPLSLPAAPERSESRRGVTGTARNLQTVKDALPPALGIRVHSRTAQPRRDGCPPRWVFAALRRGGSQPPRSFRPCRSSRLRRFTPRTPLRVCCAPQPVIGFAAFQLPLLPVSSPSGEDDGTGRLWGHPLRRKTLRSFSLTYSAHRQSQRVRQSCPGTCQRVLLPPTFADHREGGQFPSPALEAPPV